MKNVLELLERRAGQFPEKMLAADEKTELTYGALLQQARAVGSALALLHVRNAPVAVLMKKSAPSLAAFLGVVYSGNFYVVIDSEMPVQRIRTIFETLSPVGLVTELACEEKSKKLGFSGPIFFFEELSKQTIDGALLTAVRKSMIDTDPLYALFTSGSTGVPKGAVVCHRSVLAYSRWVTETFKIDETTVFGNQTPFYFSMSVLDLYATLRAGATLHIIPKAYFGFPIRLLEFMKERKVNTIYWVPSALCLVANWKALDAFSLSDLKKVLFAGEVMPTKQLNYWRRHLPHALYANLFGPTEVTDICTYYIVNREFADDEPLPIGGVCDNCGVLVVTPDNREARAGEEGELCVRGSFLAMGYYNNPEKTREAFVQNPLNPYYPELIYKTGDLVRRGQNGELYYITRKDFQIKRMGYRIELGEIETAIGALPQIKACACVYVEQGEKIRLFYQGKCKEEALRELAQAKLPKYMQPNEYRKLSQLPINANGKIDRQKLKAQL